MTARLPEIIGNGLAVIVLLTVFASIVTMPPDDEDENHRRCGMR